MGPFQSGTRFIFIVSIGRDPDTAVRVACRRTWGSNWEALPPSDGSETYIWAYQHIRDQLEKGEYLTVLDASTGKVSFYTPNREQTAWSCWIRVVDIRKYFEN